MTVERVNEILVCPFTHVVTFVCPRCDGKTEVQGTPGDDGFIRLKYPAGWTAVATGTNDGGETFSGQAVCPACSERRWS